MCSEPGCLLAIDRELWLDIEETVSLMSLGRRSLWMTVFSYDGSSGPGSGMDWERGDIWKVCAC